MKLTYTLAICLLSCFPFSMALSCMYNVRDVGFTDIGSIPYRLYYYIRSDTPENFISTFKQISYAVFMDSNVSVEVINVDQQEAHLDRMAHHLAMKYLNFWEVQSLPAAILVSPKGQSLVLSISSPNKPFKETAWSALENVVTSPKRVEILSSIIKAYCVVLLIQGNDAAENKDAQEVVADAIAGLKKIMSQMPKSIEEPPHLVVIPLELFSREKILLWSLGGLRTRGQRDKGIPSSPHLPIPQSQTLPVVAVLYGRGRLIGPLLEGEEITVNRIFNILSVIGESCECGLDRGWILGTMLPLRWGEKAQSEVVKVLGFDTESPMVKTEISQILSMGLSLGMEQSPESKFEEYSEKAVEFLDARSQHPASSIQYPVSRTVSPAQFRQLVSPRATGRLGDKGVGGKSDKGSLLFPLSPFPLVLLFVGGTVLLILAGGMFIILRARRRAS